jgi:hypothetical protein
MKHTDGIQYTWMCACDKVNPEAKGWAILAGVFFNSFFEPRQPAFGISACALAIK